MSKRLNVAIIGCGGFARNFVKLFQLHPTVDSVSVCDLVREKAESYRESFGVEIIDSFEDALKDEKINAVAIFTERHTHAPLVIQALEAGKDVYCAVPMGISVEECKTILETVKRTGRIYMMGETCIYYADSHAVKVTAFVYVDKEENTPYAVGENHWDNTFANEFCLMQLANGGIARVSECRRIGYKSPGSYVSGFYGTEGTYQFNNAQHLVTHLTKTGVTLEEVSDYVNPLKLTEIKSEPDFKGKAANHVHQWNCHAPVQAEEVKRLPQSYKEHPDENGHMGSHQFLIDDFCTAAAEGKMPRVNAWQAARYTIPGLVAHESAKLGGVPMDIPDFGEAPEM